MELLFFLSKENIELSQEEVQSVVPPSNKKSVSNILILTPSKGFSVKRLTKRLGLTKSVHQFLFSCNTKSLSKRMKVFPWNDIVKKDFVVRTEYLKPTTSPPESRTKRMYFSEKGLAKHVWHGLKNPKVNVKNPRTTITFFFSNKKAYCAILLGKVTDKFNERRAHLRPFHYSGSLHPKIARAMVNILGSPSKEPVLDPFCGAGGILLEAGLMNMPVVGYDIHWRMIEGCGKNLRHYKIKKFDIMRKDAIHLDKKINYLVTDLPYGLNSTIQSEKKIKVKQQRKEVREVEAFYTKFLTNLRPLLKKKAVIVFPDFVNCRRLLRKTKFTIEKEFSVYIHRTLTRKIVKIH